MSESIHIVCPHCEAVNRLARERLGASPSCGRCHAALFTAEPVAVNARRFERHRLHDGIPVLVDFWAPWCEPCLIMAPMFAQAAGLLEPRMRALKVDTQAEQGLGAEWGIRSIPTLALFAGGREIARRCGAIPVREIVQWARAHTP